RLRGYEATRRQGCEATRSGHRASRLWPPAFEPLRLLGFAPLGLWGFGAVDALSLFQAILDRRRRGDNTGRVILAWAHPVVRDWFIGRFGTPTEPQTAGWPAIAAGRSTLISAPTGSGKTLAAFLACIDRLVRQAIDGTL